MTSGYQPLGGLLISDRMLEALGTEGGIFTTGFTYSGHPVACAAALANLAIFEEDGILSRVRRTGPYFQRRLREELSPEPFVHTVRGMGLMCGLVLNFDEEHLERQLHLLEQMCIERGLLVRMLVRRRDIAAAWVAFFSRCQRYRCGQGIGTMVLSPSLIITEEQIDTLVSVLQDSFRQLVADENIACVPSTQSSQHS